MKLRTSRAGRKPRRQARSSGCHLRNFQKRVPLGLQPLRVFIHQLYTRLRLRRRWFEVALVDDAEIKKVNREFRGVSKATDVLSFGWQQGPEEKPGLPAVPARFAGFLGVIVISAETARRNASREEHSLRVEVQQLILHGALHLLGYDHETDDGEMEALELSLRAKLGISG